MLAATPLGRAVRLARLTRRLRRRLRRQYDLAEPLYREALQLLASAPLVVEGLRVWRESASC